MDGNPDCPQYNGVVTKAGRAVAGLLVIGALVGCAGQPQLPDKALFLSGDQGTSAGYRYRELARPKGNSDRILVLLAFSGGGARAAAMSFGVLQALNATRIGIGPNRRSLLSEVDVISGTSGGSFTAAFYGLFRDRTFAKGPNGQSLFERRYLKRRVTSALIGRVARNIVRINTAGVNRSDVAAEHYGETIFENRRFSDLRRLGRPFIVINAHDTTKLSRFTFTQGQFDQLCSGLEDYPVSRAVTASSAVHGVFSPIKLRNHAIRGRTGCPAEPAWVASALRLRPSAVSLVESPRDRRRLARTARWYRNGEPYGARAPKERPYYVHLGDGGLMDNTALWPILRALDSPISDWGIQQAIAQGRVRHVLLVVVNAMPRPENRSDSDPAGPGVISMIRSAIDSAQNTASHDAIRMAEVLMDRLRRGRYGLGGRGLASSGTSFHGPVVIEFANIREPRRRRCFDHVGTSLDLKATTIDALRKLAVQQLEADPGYRRFTAAVNGQREAGISFGSAQKFCAADDKG